MTASVVRRIDVYFENTEEFHTDTCWVDTRAGNFSLTLPKVWYIYYTFFGRCERYNIRNVKRELHKPPAYLRIIHGIGTIG